MKQAMMGWQWHQLDHIESFAPRSRQITTPAPHHSVFLQAGCSSWRRSNSVKTLTANIIVQEILKPRLHDTTGCRFDNRVKRTAVRSTGCQTGLYNRFDKHSLTTGWMFVYTIQPVVKPVVKRVWQPCWTNSFSFNRLSNRVVQLVWQPVVSCKRGLRHNATDQQADSDVQFPRRWDRASRCRRSDTRQTCVSRACLPVLPVPGTAPCRHGCLALCR